MSVVPAARIVVLGAGRHVRGAVPAAAVRVCRQGTVLDWQRTAFASIRGARMTFVGGYAATEVVNRQRDLQVVLNPDWERSGPAASLALVDLEPATVTYISYADIVYRGDVVARLAAVDADLVIAVDGRWRVRYDGRAGDELARAEKVRCRGAGIADLGTHIGVHQATAEFVGLVKWSAAAVRKYRAAVAAGTFDAGDGLPRVLCHLLDAGLTSAVLDIGGAWAELNAPQDLARFVLGTKAESLERLKPLLRHGHIADLYVLTHTDWHTRRDAVLSEIADTFGAQRVIVRSSAADEDGWEASRAGAYRSIAEVPAASPRCLQDAIDAVLASYGSSCPQHQVLVQSMVTGVVLSGVAMTRTPAAGAPYYVINYDDASRRTDTVTAGTCETLRSLVVHRGADVRADSPMALKRLMVVLQELERLVGHDSLDVEFACAADGRVHVLQVRPIAVAHRQCPMDDDAVAGGLSRAAAMIAKLGRPAPFVVGRATRLSIMLDWNPAEIIGTKPRRLAFSLYRHLITDETWARQRAEYGYRDLRPCPLLVDVLGHPYVDVRASFNSFIPAELPEALAERLVECHLRRLADRPELHDKAEFDIAVTCLTFDLDARLQRYREAGFSREETAQLADGLRRITRAGIARCPEDHAALTLAEQRFERIQNAALSPLTRAFMLLEDARRHSALIFCHLARAAFVATDLLRSLCRAGVISKVQVDAFAASLRTVSSRMQQEARDVAGGRLSWETWVQRYGHLRPGTYDLTCPTYAADPEAFLRPIIRRAAIGADRPPAAPVWNAATARQIEHRLQALGLDLDLPAFERFLRVAIEGRELGKFVYSKHLSAALEALAEFGAEHGITREQLSGVRLHDVLELQDARAPAATLEALSRRGEEEYAITRAAQLPAQIADAADLYCFAHGPAEPNFITRKRVSAVVDLLSPRQPDAQLDGKIAVIPNADPGYDWLFSRNIAGLVTMYGGSNSHMAVRAAEFQLPAAIGVGAPIYERISQAEMLELDCASNRIRVIR